MSKKSSNISMLAMVLVGVLVGAMLLTFNRQFNPKEKMKAVGLEAKIESLLEKEAFFLRGETRSDFIAYLVSTAKAHQFDPLLILAIIKVESSFKPQAMSNRGALGLLQLKPIAAKEVSLFFDLARVTPHQLMDPFINIRFGIHYLSFLRGAVGKNWMRILAAYNAGPTYIRNAEVIPTGYASKVLKTYREIIKQVGAV